jgi:hypothetical protein
LPSDHQRRSFNFLTCQIEPGLAAYDALFRPPDLFAPSPSIVSPETIDYVTRFAGYDDAEWAEFKMRAKLVMADFAKRPGFLVAGRKLGTGQGGERMITDVVPLMRERAGAGFSHLWRITDRPVRAEAFTRVGPFSQNWPDCQG